MERVSSEGVANVLGLNSIDDIFTIPFRELKEKQHVTALPLCALDVLYLTPRKPCSASCALLSSTEVHAAMLRIHKAVQELLVDMGIPPSSYPRGLPHRAVYCSRTLNLRSIQACTDSTL